MPSDFSAMTKAELRAYVIAHPSDQTAFHAFVDRFTSEASSETFDLPQTKIDVEAIELLIKQKLEQLNFN